MIKEQIIQALESYTTCDDKTLEEIFTCDSPAGEIIDLALHIVNQVFIPTEEVVDEFS